MKYITTITVTALCFLFFYNCKTKENKEQPALSDSTASIVEDEPAPEKANNIVHYSGAVNDSVKIALETFSPLTQVYTLASNSIHIKDSIEVLRETQDLLDPKDSAIFTPYESQAYQAILAYKQSMASGVPLQGPCPDLLDLTRMVDSGDSSFNVLPEAGRSKFLAGGKFFFLGGWPFIYKLEQEANTVFADPQGNPETRFESSITENANFLLTSIGHFKKERMNVSFGAPLGSYDSGPQEVHGIGSLRHEFAKRIPVFFLTENGVVPAHLIAVTVKIVPENLGCVSDQPSVEFACSRSLEANDILGVYIPYLSPPPTSFIVRRQNNIVWTADMNGDGIAEIACVSGTFEGISDDTMADVLWFVNVDGTWKIIDWGQELDCT
jgi:hypothetical protein